MPPKARFALARVVPVLAALLAVADGAGAATGSGGEGDVALGAPDAPVTVIEYASVTCPHCARWDSEVFPAFKRKYVDTGKARYILREFPTEPEEWAEAGFMVARCAGPAKFFDVVEAFMAGQKTLFETHDGRAWLVNGGAVGGLGAQQVEACLKDVGNQKAMAARLEANDKAFKVEGTPTFFINGKPAGDGELSLADLDKAIAAAQAPPPAPAHSARPAAKTRAAAKTTAANTNTNTKAAIQAKAD
jgi:protein-disulfide isomerase